MKTPPLLPQPADHFRGQYCSFCAHIRAEHPGDGPCSQPSCQCAQMLVMINRPPQPWAWKAARSNLLSLLRKVTAP